MSWRLCIQCGPCRLMQVAASRGHDEMMRLLLDHGANVHAIPNWHVPNRHAARSVPSALKLLRSREAL